MTGVCLAATTIEELIHYICTREPEAVRVEKECRNNYESKFRAGWCIVMKSLLLLCVVSAFFIFGYFVMKRLDCFLYRNRMRLSTGSGAGTLRIAFETPALADSTADVLEEFSISYPDCELNLFFGTVSEIKKALKNNKLDLGFIETDYCRNDAGEHDGSEFAAKILSINHNTVSLDSIGLPMSPLGESEIVTEVIWKNKDRSKNKYERIFLSQIYAGISANKLKG